MTLSDFASSKERFSLTAFDGYLLRKVGVDIARGDLDGARATCAESPPDARSGRCSLMRDEFVRITGALCPLLASNDRPAMARLLHQWEAFTVDKLKIGHIFEPTPFPLELQSV